MRNLTQTLLALRSFSVVGALALIIGLFLFSYLVFDKMPEQMVSHWNAEGIANGTMPRFWGTFLMPLIAAGLFLLFRLLPLIDPLKENIASFRKHYDGFIFVLILFLTFIHVLIVAWNLGVMFPMDQMIVGGIGVLFFYIGIVLKHVKSNPLSTPSREQAHRDLACSAYGIGVR